jgi:hypothetical protein
MGDFSYSTSIHVNDIYIMGTIIAIHSVTKKQTTRSGFFSIGVILVLVPFL